MAVQRDLVVWSFFAGAMGLDLGLEASGLRPSLAVEVHPVFCRTVRANRPRTAVVQSDVAALTGDGLRAATGVRDVDVMVGGPPCQSFSPGGNRAALADPRGNALFEYLRLVSEVRPAVFVLENVANLVTAAARHRPIAQRPGRSWNLASYSDGACAGSGARRHAPADADGQAPPLDDDELSGSAVRYLLATVVAGLGYQVRFAVLDAADYGAPQRRLRFVMVGRRDGPPPDFVPPTHGSGRRPFTTVRDAIGDLVDAPGPGAAYTPETQGYFALVPPGGSWRDLPRDVAARAMGERALRAGGGKTGFFRRLHWDRLAPTVTGKPNRKGSAMCHPERTRPLSVRECARLQGFPDHWQVHGSVADRYLQIGNAVPVALGRAIGQTLRREPPAAGGTDHAAMLDAAVRRLRASARNTRARSGA